MDHSLDDLLPPSRTGHAAHPLLNMHHYTSLALPSRVAAANHLVFLMPPHYRRPPVSSPQSRRLHLSPSLPLLIRREEGDFFSQIQKRESDQGWRRPWQRPHCLLLLLQIRRRLGGVLAGSGGGAGRATAVLVRL